MTWTSNPVENKSTTSSGLTTVTDTPDGLVPEFNGRVIPPSYNWTNARHSATVVPAPAPYEICMIGAPVSRTTKADVTLAVLPIPVLDAFVNRAWM